MEERHEPDLVQETLFDVSRIGKDEMNLVEHPFASLSKEKDARVIELEWITRHPVTGQERPAKWRVAGDPQMGLPTANDEKVYLVAMEMTREAGWEQTVYFTRHEFLKRLGWSHDQHSYRRLWEAFQRLGSVTITATNAFWNPKRKSFYDGVFNLLEVIVANEDPGRKRPGARERESYFKWSDIVFDAMRGGNIRTLDLEFALSLERPLSLRLFRVLDKKTHGGKRPLSISVHDLCKYHLGMVVEGRYESNLKASLDPAHSELIQRGYLTEATYEPMKTRRGSKVSYRIALRNRSEIETGDVHGSKPQDDQTKKQLQLLNPPTQKTLIPVDADLLPTPDEETTAVADGVGDKIKATNELLVAIQKQGVSPSVAQELIDSFPAELIQGQLDCLADREPKNPPAALVKSIRQNWNPPPSYQQRLKDKERGQQLHEAVQANRMEKANQQAKEREATALQEAEISRLDNLWNQLDESTRQRIDLQAKESLGVLGRTGRANAALTAMRRNLLRAMLDDSQKIE
jgi:hypothetical protein